MSASIVCASIHSTPSGRTLRVRRSRPPAAVVSRILTFIVQVASILTVGGSPASLGSAQPALRNVLLIIVDDLRPDIGAYGASFMHTPHMDQLAATGTLFQRAYAQYSLCMPSRNSFMTGRRPDKVQTWRRSGGCVDTYFREPGKGFHWSSMPQYFKERGYLTLGAGKIFHPSSPPSFDAQKGWTFFTHAGVCKRGTRMLEDHVTNVKCVPTTRSCANDAMIEGDGKIWCKTNMTLLARPLEDEVIRDVTIANLQQASTAAQPFFIAAGFTKPHMPFQYPADFDTYPPASEIALPKQQSPPKDMPLCAWHGSPFLESDKQWSETCDYTREYRRAYYTSVTYTDANIGKVLGTLDELGLTSTTAVVVLGDHGWHLGEMNLWRKMTNFEVGVRVPLIIRAPWAQRAGVKTPALAEAVDVFPTLVELSGLPAVPVSEGLDGMSLAGVIADPPSQGTGPKRYAFSQFAKGSEMSYELGRQVHWDIRIGCGRAPDIGGTASAPTIGSSGIELMGYSIRSDDWRLTEWVHWDSKASAPLWHKQEEGLELYDHKGDFGEDLDKSTPTENVAHLRENVEVVRELRQALREQFDNDHATPTWI